MEIRLLVRYANMLSEISNYHVTVKTKALRLERGVRGFNR